jgi:hypothetical protein
MIISNRKINRIIVSGCSVTYGDGLTNRATETWVAHLARQFEVECVNLAYPAMGNEHVSSSLIDYFAFNPKHKQDSFVIPCFTRFTRIEVAARQPAPMLKRGWTTILNSTIEPEFTQMFFENFFDENYYYARYLRIVITLQHLFSSWDVPYLMCEGLKNNHAKLSNNPINKKLIEQIDSNTWFNFLKDVMDPLSDMSKRLPCNHPNATAHHEFSKLLYQHIINSYATE